MMRTIRSDMDDDVGGDDHKKKIAMIKDFS